MGDTPQRAAADALGVPQHRVGSGREVIEVRLELGHFGTKCKLCREPRSSQRILQVPVRVKGCAVGHLLADGKST